MNKKLIALTVSSALASPLTLAEDSGPNLYGRINLALELDDSGDDTATDIRDVVSRFGIRGEEDLGNDLSVLYQYEFRVNADQGSLSSAGNPDATAQRLTWLGLRGGFGEFRAGTIWGTHFNLVGTHLDPTYSLGYFGYSSYAFGDYRIESVVNYTGNFGPVSVGVDLQIDNNNEADDDLDRFVIGAKYNGPLSLAVVYDERKTSDEDADGNAIEGDNDIELITLTAAYVAEGWNLNTGVQYTEDDSGEIDRTTYHINGSFNIGDSNQVLLGYWTGEGDGDDNTEADGFFAGFYHTLSSRTRLYFEGHNGDRGESGLDANVYLVGIRHDF